MKDSPNLDVLRSIAVGLVVLSHLGENFGWGGRFDMVSVGRVGVAMFFVHTSLVLMYSLERQEDTVAFYVRRFFRIYPLAVFMVLLVAGGNWLGGNHIDPWRLVSNLVLIQNLTGHESFLAPMWSLPYEVQMYLFLPALYAVTRTSHQLLWLAVIYAGALSLGMSAELLSYVPCFLPGVLAYVLRRNGRWSPLALLGLIAAGVLVVPMLVAQGIPQTPLLWVLCLALGLVIPMCREITNQPVARASKTIATYSYSIYLTHLFAIGAGFAIIPLPPLLQWAVFIGMLFAWPRVAYKWIEAPGVRLGMRLAQQATKTTGRAEAVVPVPHV